VAETWLKCSACKNPIPYNATHWVCSVSTCNRSRTRLVFCTVSCWDSHVAMLRHRDAWAVEAKAPSKEAWERELAENPPDVAPAPAPAAAPVQRKVVGMASPSAAAAAEGVQLSEAEREILIVVSKMKKYIKDRSGMNCSDAVAEMLSDHVRAICDDAIRAAARDERKTVLDRDVPRARR
jgi:histone H3/H4